MSRIHLSPPDVNGVDRANLLAAIDANWVAPAGPDIAPFEHEVAGACGRAAGVALSSGTAGLHLLLRELGVGPGDEVIVSSFTFVATANAVAYCGATPVLVDADADTWQVSPALLADAVAAHPRAAAAIVVDLYGRCADYTALVPLLEGAGIALVEDAAEALGATHAGRPAGSFGTAAVVSFNGNKIITTSGGGMVVTDDEHLAGRCRFLATQAREPFLHYEHEELGHNYRLSNLLAAFGRGQLGDLDRRVARRRQLNRRYRDALAEVPGVSFMPHDPGSTAWLTCITLDPASARAGRDEVIAALEADDIEARPTWKPMHLQPLYRDAPKVVDGTSERLFERGLCLPSGSGLTDAEQDRVVARLLSSLAG